MLGGTYAITQCTISMCQAVVLTGLTLWSKTEPPHLVLLEQEQQLLLHAGTLVVVGCLCGHHCMIVAEKFRLAAQGLTLESNWLRVAIIVAPQVAIAAAAVALAAAGVAGAAVWEGMLEEDLDSSMGIASGAPSADSPELAADAVCAVRRRAGAGSGPRSYRVNQSNMSWRTVSHVSDSVDRLSGSLQTMSELLSAEPSAASTAGGWSTAAVSGGQPQSNYVQQQQQRRSVAAEVSEEEHLLASVAGSEPSFSVQLQQHHQHHQQQQQYVASEASGASVAPTMAAGVAGESSSGSLLSASATTTTARGRVRVNSRATSSLALSHSSSSASHHHQQQQQQPPQLETSSSRVVLTQEPSHSSSSHSSGAAAPELLAEVSSAVAVLGSTQQPAVYCPADYQPQPGGEDDPEEVLFLQDEEDQDSVADQDLGAADLGGSYDEILEEVEEDLDDGLQQDARRVSGLSDLMSMMAPSRTASSAWQQYGQSEGQQVTAGVTPKVRALENLKRLRDRRSSSSNPGDVVGTSGLAEGRVSAAALSSQLGSSATGVNAHLASSQVSQRRSHNQQHQQQEEVEEEEVLGYSHWVAPGSSAASSSSSLFGSAAAASYLPGVTSSTSSTMFVTSSRRVSRVLPALPEEPAGIDQEVDQERQPSGPWVEPLPPLQSWQSQPQQQQQQQQQIVGSMCTPSTSGAAPPDSAGSLVRLSSAPEGLPPLTGAGQPGQTRVNARPVNSRVVSADPPRARAAALARLKQELHQRRLGLSYSQPGGQSSTGGTSDVLPQRSTFSVAGGEGVSQSGVESAVGRRQAWGSPPSSPSHPSRAAAAAAGGGSSLQLYINSGSAFDQSTLRLTAQQAGSPRGQPAWAAAGPSGSSNYNAASYAATPPSAEVGWEGGDPSSSYNGSGTGQVPGSSTVNGSRSFLKRSTRSVAGGKVDWSTVPSRTICHLEDR
jgi:hypothetical protein